MISSFYFLWTHRERRDGLKRGFIIGRGAVVRENIPDYAVVIGNPAVVSNITRTSELDYSPVLFNAPFEAWVGRNIHAVSKERV